MVMMTNPFAKFPNQPTDHFFERLGGSTLRKDNSITFQSDLSSSTGWTTTGSKVSIDTTNEEIDFSFNTDNGDLSHTYYDLTSVSDTKWVLRSQIDIDTVTQGSDVNDVFIFHGIGSTNQNGNETQDFLGLMFRVDNTKTDIFAIETDGSHPNNETTTLFTRQLQAETLYVEMIRESATSFTVNLYSDSGYSTLLESKTITVPSSVQTLRYLKVAGLQGFSDSQVVGSVSNITLYNDVTSTTQVGIKQHFIEWFSGKQLPSYWTKSEVNPPASFDMSDSVDGGFRITADGGALNEGMINFNNKRAFSKTGSVCIWVGRDVQTSSYTGYYGLANGITGNDADMGQLATIYNASANGVIALRTGNTTKGNTESTISLDTNFHNYKIEMKTSSAEWSVDGVAQTTRTLTLPTEDLQPVAGVHGNNKSIDVRYMECYNT